MWRGSGSAKCWLSKHGLESGAGPCRSEPTVKRGPVRLDTAVDRGLFLAAGLGRCKAEAVAAPSGTVTFLFTDIEGSTRLWDERPDLMRPALLRHDAIIRGVVGDHGGHIFATGGDGFAVAFQRSSDAVLAALDAQRALQTEPWVAGAELRVRAGLHSGEAEERDGDYFGPTVNRAARVMSAAHGGQVLLSGATAELVGSLDGVELVDLGSLQLKGLMAAVRVFALRAEGLSWVDPPLVTDQEVPGNLPRPATEFVGRVDLLRRRAAELPRRRVVTLTGPGGVGKTRAAIEVGWLTLDLFPGGVWMVELAAVTDPAVVIAAVAAALSVQPQPGMSMLGSILDWLANRRLLLILDNCEHVLEPVAEMVSAIVGGTATVTVLATSREPLGVPGERVVAVESLPLPDAVELFRERAAAADDSFPVSDGDLEQVEAICARLDGIPLAIELAAARVRSLTLADLAARLGDRFRLLRGGGRGGMERHQTLRAAVAWSYQLLTQSEQVLFARLAVFGGGFDLDAAEAVCVDEVVEVDDVLDLLSSLVDKSMVIADRSGPSTRYRLLETLRQYAEERLHDSGETAATRDRHFAHFLSVCRAARALQMGSREIEAVALFDREWDNVRSAQEWAALSDNLDATQALLRATFVYAWQHMLLEHAEWTERLVDSGPGGVQLQSCTYLSAGTWALFALDFDRLARLAAAGIRANSDLTDVAVCGYLLTSALFQQGQFADAEAALRAAEVAANESGDPYATFWVLQGWIQIGGDQPDVMSDAITRLSGLARSTGAPWMLGGAHFAVATQRLHAGDFDGALEGYRSAQSLAVTTGSVAFEGSAGSGVVSATLGPPRATPTPECRAVLTRLHDTRCWIFLWACIDTIANYLARSGHIEAAATIIGYLEANISTWMDAALSRTATLEILHDHPNRRSCASRGAAMNADELFAFVLEQVPAGP